MEGRSVLALKREAVRFRPETIQFKEELERFFDGNDPELIYVLKKDLACMTSMPYYKNRPARMKTSRTSRQLLEILMASLLAYGDNTFAQKLLRNLNKNQAQTIRKLAPKVGKKAAIWEHAIPAAYIVNELIAMLIAQDISLLPQLLDIYQLAGQRPLTKKQDGLLKDYKNTMPPCWSWKDGNANPLERYRLLLPDFQINQ